jgi:hypothetical protein
MSIIYRGTGTDTLHLQPGAAWGRSEEGLDVLLEVYAGPIPAKAAWLAAYPLGRRHPLYPSMYLVANPDEDGRSWSTVQLRWLGLRSGGSLPPPILGRRTSVKTASSTTDSPEVAHRDVTYVSPEIVWTYATDREVVAAQQSPFGTVPGFAEEILRDVITTDEGKRYPGSAPAALVSALSMSPAWRLSSLDSQEIRYTPFWSNQEVWAYEYPQ